MGEIEDVRYKIIDFRGYVQWARLDDGSYVVDPLYLTDFLKYKGCRLQTEYLTV